MYDEDKHTNIHISMDFFFDHETVFFLAYFDMINQLKFFLSIQKHRFLWFYAITCISILSLIFAASNWITLLTKYKSAKRQWIDMVWRKKDEDEDKKRNESHTTIGRDHQITVVVSVEIADQYANQLILTLCITNTHTEL